ncbi:MAG: hypothetical protein HY286_10155 [Planctomycetes bacterium]|nr:hypothetical protein [Planctomycetota bacterium]
MPESAEYQKVILDGGLDGPNPNLESAFAAIEKGLTAFRDSSPTKRQLEAAQEVEDAFLLARRLLATRKFEEFHRLRKKR